MISAFNSDTLLVVSCLLADMPDDTSGLLPLLAPVERSRAAELPPKQRRLFVLSRALTRSAAAALLERPPESLQIERSGDGKPHFAGAGAELKFNYSHSNDWLLLALARGGEVGVDIETERRKNRLPAIAQRYFLPVEVAAMTALHDERLRRQRFVELWTLKEAYAKALGSGLAATLHGMCFDISPSGRHAHLRTEGSARWPGRVDGWQWRTSAQNIAALIHLSDAEPAATPLLLQARPNGRGGFDYATWQVDPIRTVDVPAAVAAGEGPNPYQDKWS